MAAESKSLEPLSGKPKSPSGMEEKIRLRAYQLYEQRGKIDGFAVHDWLQAESEILGEQKPRRATREKKPKQTGAREGK